MRRDDAKKLIAALIRRRHNDALKIKRLRSRLNDDGSGLAALVSKAVAVLKATIPKDIKQQKAIEESA